MATSQKIVVAVVMLCFVLNGVVCQQTANESDGDVSEGRTFAHHLLKRVGFMLIPGAFVVGVITTLLAALTIVSIKGLGVGVILLVIAIGQMLSRALPQVHASAAYAAPISAPAPLPIVYSHAHTQQPVWLEKEWK